MSRHSCVPLLVGTAITCTALRILLGNVGLRVLRWYIATLPKN